MSLGFGLRVWREDLHLCPSSQYCGRCVGRLKEVCVLVEANSSLMANEDLRDIASLLTA